MSGLTVSIRNILEEVSLSFIFPDSLKIYINNYCSVFQMQVHIPTQEGFRAVQAKSLHFEFHHSPSFSAMPLQQCLQMGIFSPLMSMYSLMFSLLQLFFQGFLQCSNTLCSFCFKFSLVETPFKAHGETAYCYSGGFG